MTRDIDYDLLLSNTRKIIQTLEFDCQRSSGKVKFNVTTLNELYKLEATLKAKLNRKEEPMKKPKKEAN